MDFLEGLSTAKLIIIDKAMTNPCPCHFIEWTHVEMWPISFQEAMAETVVPHHCCLLVVYHFTADQPQADIIIL